MEVHTAHGIGKAIDYFDDLEASLAAYLPHDKNASILDIGCGFGRVLAFLRRAGFANAHGIDHDPHVIAEAAKTFGDKVEVVTKLESYLIAKKGTLDFIVLKDVLNYFTIDEALPLVGAMRDALKPGGGIFVELPNGAQITSAFQMEKDYGIRRVYNETSLRAILEDKGFEVIALFGTPYNPKTLRGHAYKIAAAGWRLATRAVYLLDRGACPNNPTIFAPSVIAIGRRPF